MIRARPVLLAAALALSGAACTSAQSTPAGVRLRQPSAVAVFRGRTLQDGVNVKPYLVVANQSRNDLSVLDAVTNLPVASPIKLQTLVIPVGNRPAHLVTASLEDGEADLLVAVSAGDSVLQVVETWNSANVVHAAPEPLAVDLGFDVLALAAMPSEPGTARLAAALSDRRLAVVEYARGGDGQSIVFVSRTIVPLPFQPESVAAMPDDPDTAGVQTALYVATLDPVASSPQGVYGVAEISADLLAIQPLGARAPTRLVAAARIQERKADSAASDRTAFEGQPRVPRVYAVLDEASCGITKPIDCGVVVLDPLSPGVQSIPPDYAGLMPYRAPMRVRGRALALAVSGPPAVQPVPVEGEPDYSGGYMRLYMGTIARATTAVAAVASDDGHVYFLDLGRFETATTVPLISFKSTGVPLADYVDDKRLWIQNPADGTFASTSVAAATYLTVTPGFTPDETWDVTWQGPVAPDDLVTRSGEAGEYVPGRPWIALQLGDGAGGGTRILNEVVRLWHPALGVRATDPARGITGDLVVIRARGMPSGCVGNVPPNTPPTLPAASIEREVEFTIDELLPPAPGYPGGAVSVVAPPESSDPDTEAGRTWACYAALRDAASGTNVWSGLTVTVRARELVLTGVKYGYAGRPERGVPYVLEYPTDPAQDEDDLAAACPVADWQGGWESAPPCDSACRAACETLVLARKARRFHNVSVDCATNPADTGCADRWPGLTFPVVNGPALGFQVDVQARNTATTDPQRDLKIRLTPASAVSPLSARGTNTSPYHASGAVAFDRSPWTDPVAGYRFYVSYPADFVLDTTPSQTPLPSNVIR